MEVMTDTWIQGVESVCCPVWSSPSWPHHPNFESLHHSQQQKGSCHWARHLNTGPDAHSLSWICRCQIWKGQGEEILIVRTVVQKESSKHLPVVRQLTCHPKSQQSWFFKKRAFITAKKKKIIWDLSKMDMDVYGDGYVIHPYTYKAAMKWRSQITHTTGDKNLQRKDKILSWSQL